MPKIVPFSEGNSSFPVLQSRSNSAVLPSRLWGGQPEVEKQEADLVVCPFGIELRHLNLFLLSSVCSW